MDKNKFILGILTSVAGLLMIVSPETFVTLIVIILGVAAIVDGLFIMITTRNLILDPQYKTIMTVRGVLSIFVGILAILLPLFVAAVVYKVMAYVLAVYLIISAIMESYGISKLHRNGIMIRQSVIEVAISVLLAVVLFIIPARTAGSVIVRICGIVILLTGLIWLFVQWKNRPITVPAEDIVVEEESVSQE